MAHLERTAHHTERRSLWTYAEVAEHLDVSPMTVRRMVARGDLQTVRIGRRLVRFRRADVLKLTGEPEPGDREEVT